MIVAIGMDPGPTPGLVKLVYAEAKLIQVNVVQCSLNCALDVLNLWLAAHVADTEVYVGVERFVIGNGSYRSGSAGARTRDLVGSALVSAQTHGAIGVQRSAVEVKAWATDMRLSAAGLTPHVKGMTHARDAARHALYTACKDGAVPDPLSKRGRQNDES